MKVENANGILLSLSGEEVADLKIIAKRDGITLEKALSKCVKNYNLRKMKNIKKKKY